MKKPWEEISPWRVCETCHCEYNCEYEGNAWVCEACREQEIIEAMEDEDDQ